MKDIEIYDHRGKKEKASEFVEKWERKRGPLEAVIWAHNGVLLTAEDDVAEELIGELERLGFGYEVVANY